MNYKFLLVLVATLTLYSCSLQRQSALSRHLFVKQDTQKIETKGVEKEIAPQKEELALTAPAANIEKTIPTEKLQPTESKPVVPKKEEKSNIKTFVNSFKEKLFANNSNYYINDRASKAEEEEYVNDQSGKALTFSLMGLIFGAINFLIFPISGLLSIAFGSPFFILGALALCFLFGVLGLVFSIIGKRIVRKYRTDKTPQEGRKWRSRSALGIVGIVLSAITLGIFFLGLLITLIVLLLI